MLLDDIKNIRSSRRDLRNFGLTVGIALVVLGVIFFFLEKQGYIVLLALGAAFVLVGLTIPIILKPLQKIWMTLAVIIGWFMTRVILSILFFVIITPIGLIARLFGKRFLELQTSDSQDSYWNYREEKEPERTDYERQF